MTKQKLNEKRKIKKELDLFSDSVLDDSVDSLIGWLQTLKKTHEPFSDLRLESNVQHGYYEETWTEYILYGWRLETDEEVKKRVEWHKRNLKRIRESKKKAEEKKAEKERIEYERLKKKFETKGG